jgi:hypothetical protein
MRRENRLFSEPATFQEAFPQLADAVVECREEGKDAAGEVKRAMASDDSLEGLVPCSNRGCRSGGFEVDLIFHEMVQAGHVQREGVLACPGTERPPTLVTDETRPVEEFYDRVEHEVDEWERKTGKSYSYDGTMSEKLKRGTAPSGGRCPNVLHYVIRLTYRSTSA